MDENTEFQFAGDHTVWWIPADWDSYEHLYNTSLISEIDAIERGKIHSISYTSIKDNAIHTLLLHYELKMGFILAYTKQPYWIMPA